jgi:chromosome segregation ATPase
LLPNPPKAKIEETIYKGSIMDWTQAITVIGTNIALLSGFIIYLLGRMDANKRDTDHKIDSVQKENNAKFEKVLGLMDSNQKENNAKFEAINGRFNGLENRLTAMEVEIKNTNQRLTDFQGQINQRLSTIEGYLVPKKVFHFEESHKGDDEEPKEN